MQRDRDKNHTGMSRHHLSHNFLGTHCALIAVEEVRLEGNRGSKWFEPQLQMIESNNPNALVQSSAYTLLLGEKEGMVQETSERCGERFLTTLNTAPRLQAGRCQRSSCQNSLPTVPLLSLFHYDWSGEAWSAVCGQSRSGRGEWAEPIAGVRQVSSLILVVPLEVKK